MITIESSGNVMEGGGGRGKEEVRNKMRGGEEEGVAVAGERRRGGWVRRWFGCRYSLLKG